VHALPLLRCDLPRRGKVQLVKALERTVVHALVLLRCDLPRRGKQYQAALGLVVIVVARAQWR
jgi:hypothetical protein